MGGATLTIAGATVGSTISQHWDTEEPAFAEEYCQLACNWYKVPQIAIDHRCLDITHATFHNTQMVCACVMLYQGRITCLLPVVHIHWRLRTSPVFIKREACYGYKGPQLVDFVFFATCPPPFRSRVSSMAKFPPVCMSVRGVPSPCFP